jgi:hypothetical protein
VIGVECVVEADPMAVFNNAGPIIQCEIDQNGEWHLLCNNKSAHIPFEVNVITLTPFCVVPIAGATLISTKSSCVNMS